MFLTFEVDLLVCIRFRQKIWSSRVFQRK